MDDKEKPAGAAVQAVFAARGYHMTLDEARRFAETMIDLVCRGAIVPMEHRDQSDKVDEEP